MPRKKTLIARGAQPLGKKEEATTGVQEDLRVGLTGVLRPVPQENVFRKAPKILFAILALTLLFLFVLKANSKSKSQIQILAKEDKFILNFDLKGNDPKKASQLLEKLEVPQDVLSGMEFTLDSTSSAKLAFASPISLNTKFSKNNISFSGSSQIPLVEANLTPEPFFKIPAETEIAIFTKDFKKQLQKKFELGQNLTTWTNDNLNPTNGAYLIVFGGNNFAIIFKPSKPLDFQTLENIKDAKDPESPYRQETEGDVTIHLFKLPQEETTLAFFEVGKWAYVASSLDGAKQILAVQRGDAKSVNFPKVPKNVSLVIYAKNNREETDPDLSLVAANYETFTEYMEKIKEALLIIDEKKISGYINF